MNAQVWTPLLTETCMAVANAKINEFEYQCHRIFDLVRLHLLSLVDAADLLNEVANYNSLTFEYGTDKIQALMSSAFQSEAA